MRPVNKLCIPLAHPVGPVALTEWAVLKTQLLCYLPRTPLLDGAHELGVECL